MNTIAIPVIGIDLLMKDKTSRRFSAPGGFHYISLEYFLPLIELLCTRYHPH